MPGPSKVMAIAVFSGNVGHVLLVDGVPTKWGTSHVAAENPARATALAAEWFARLRPEVVVTEKVGDWMRKSERTRNIIRAIAAAAADSGAYDVCVPRRHTHRNKYEEAAVLVQRFPQLAQWLPTKRVTWKSEPWTTVYFEALALAVPVIDGTAPEGN